MSVNFNIRQDKQLKARAFPIIKSYRITPAQAIKLFLNQMANTQKAPLSFDYHVVLQPNATTVKAIKEA